MQIQIQHTLTHASTEATLTSRARRATLVASLHHTQALRLGSWPSASQGLPSARTASDGDAFWATEPHHAAAAAPWDAQPPQHPQQQHQQQFPATLDLSATTHAFDQRSAGQGLSACETQAPAATLALGPLPALPAPRAAGGRADGVGVGGFVAYEAAHGPSLKCVLPTARRSWKTCVRYSWGERTKERGHRWARSSKAGPSSTPWRDESGVSITAALGVLLCELGGFSSPCRVCSCMTVVSLPWRVSKDQQRARSGRSIPATHTLCTLRRCAGARPARARTWWRAPARRTAAPAASSTGRWPPFRGRAGAARAASATSCPGSGS